MNQLSGTLGRAHAIKADELGLIPAQVMWKTLNVALAASPA